MIQVDIAIPDHAHMQTILWSKGHAAVGKVTGLGLPMVFGSWVTRVWVWCPDLGPVGILPVIPWFLQVSYRFINNNLILLQNIIEPKKKKRNLI